MKRMMHCIILILMNLSMFPLSTGQKTARPENTAIVVGQGAAFTCAVLSSPQSGLWSFYEVAGNPQSLAVWTSAPDCILTGGNPVNFTCEATSVSFSLHIISGTYDLARTHECWLLQLGVNFYSAGYLIVLNNSVSCPDTIRSAVGETADVTCSLGYGGEWPPELEWTGDVPYSSLSNGTVGQQMQSVIDAGPFEMEDSTRTLTCTASIKILSESDISTLPQRPQGTNIVFANNIPDLPGTELFINTCDVQFDLQYNVTDVVITPPALLEVLEVLTCTADGNPTPTFKWTAEANPEFVLSTTAELIIPEEFAGENMTFICTAENFLDYIGFSSSLSATIQLDISPIPTTVPTTVQETTIPETTIPDTTIPETTIPDTTIPKTTIPETTTLTTETDARTTITRTTQAYPEPTATTTSPTTTTTSPPSNTETTNPGTPVPPSTQDPSEDGGFTFELWLIILLCILATLLLVTCGALLVKCFASKKVITKDSPPPIVYAQTADPSVFGSVAAFQGPPPDLVRDGTMNTNYSQRIGTVTDPYNWQFQERNSRQMPDFFGNGFFNSQFTSNPMIEEEDDDILDDADENQFISALSRGQLSPERPEEDEVSEAGYGVKDREMIELEQTMRLDVDDPTGIVTSGRPLSLGETLHIGELVSGQGGGPDDEGLSSVPKTSLSTPFHQTADRKGLDPPSIQAPLLPAPVTESPYLIPRRSSSGPLTYKPSPREILNSVPEENEDTPASSTPARTLVPLPDPVSVDDTKLLIEEGNRNSLEVVNNAFRDIDGLEEEATCF